jgi:peptidoglycan/LPS O-acetylase OafA/YrhL
LFFVQNYWWFPGPTPAHTWTLSVEEHFYLVIPFVLAFLLRRNRLEWLFMIVAGGELVSIVFRATGASQTHTHVRFTELLAGVALRASWVKWPALEIWCKRNWIWLLALSLVAYSLNQAVPNWAHITILGIAGVLMVGSTYHLSGDSFPKWLRWLAFVPKSMARVGYYSYSIYLWHVTVGRTADRYTVRYIDVFGWFPCMIASTICALGFGILMAHLVEYPILRIRDKYWPSNAERHVPRERTSAASSCAEPAGTMVPAK